MKAIIQRDYGSPDVFELKEIEKPVPKDNEILVRVYSAALHAGDYYTMRGKPYLARLVSGIPKPKNYIPGIDLAGRVEAVGKKTTRFKTGDEVFGSSWGACSEYACGKEKTFIHKPRELTFEQAAAVPTSALTALIGLRDAGKIKSGSKVLINGASGGVGTFAIQIAKAFGAEVTGVCSTKNIDLVRSIGADNVIDYTKEDFTNSSQRFDIILDQVANHTLSNCRKVLTADGKHLPNSGESGIVYVLKSFVSSLFNKQQGKPFIALAKPNDLSFLKDLIESGKLTSVIDRKYTLEETADAFRYLEKRHARGKVVINVYKDN